MSGQVRRSLKLGDEGTSAPVQFCPSDASSDRCPCTRWQYGRSAENSRSDVPLGSDPDPIKLPKSGLLPPNGGYRTVRRGLSSCRITRMNEQIRLVRAN